ncbi:LytR/AlgR family response regulator transcription factor [Lacrimispora defluvii]|uniref:Stage 0 sporulation protein A homolog n=1 Tax=Lacrimispora defluvii TaxID=2719233 RepID=A0ABX1VKS0_9FIRM|nr:LytTR family transcriptional regulator DNA-binding domain-containing protein [Lacrimispora defluvii]NNJ28554.1 response regulator [Lacrimispora defluvii]
MKLVILDSITTDRNNLIVFLERYFRKRLIDFSLHEYSFHKTMFERVNFQSEKLPCCFIDLTESEQNGLETGLKIREMNQDSIIFFTSNSTKHAAEAFKMQADGYFLKPIRNNELIASLDKSLKNINFIYKKIQIRSEYMTMNIPLKDIIYIEVFNKTCIIYTKQKTITSSISLSELEERLKKEGFLRCHKSYLVNMLFIEEYNNFGFFLTNKQFIPISKRECLKHRETHLNWLWKTIPDY